MMRYAIRRGAWLAATTACVLSAPAQTAGHAAARATAQTALPVRRAVGARQLDVQIAAILAPPAVARDHWGIQVTTLDGTVLYSLNPAQLFQPASNAKLFTTAAALALLPATRRLKTTATGAGVFLEDGTLRGDLILNGGNDANFCAHDLPYPAPSAQSGVASEPPLRDLEELADQVKASGLKRVEGDVTATGWNPYPLGWSADDLIWGYAAPPSALSIGDNTLKLTVSPTNLVTSTTTDPLIANAPIMSKLTMQPAPSGVQFAAAARVDQAIPYYTVQMYANSSVDKQPTSIQITHTLGSRTIQVSGHIALGAKPLVEEIAIDDPQEYAAMAFRQMLIERGISVTGSGKASPHYSASMTGTTTDFLKEISESIANLSPVQASQEFPIPARGMCGDCDPRSGLRTLATHLSPPLGDDVVVTNKQSLNLHAELLLLELGAAEQAEGARVVRQFLVNAGINGKDFVLFDGSGLSTQDLVTPRATAKLLSFAAHDPATGAPQPWFAQWKASLPVGGVDGTLATRFTRPPLKGHVFAKTGTHSEGRALSGYLDAASGRTIIFSIFVGDHLPSTTDDRDAMDRIVAAIQAAE
ncbi:MAG TPA: D-alanyl-D-alanine carboxypeptidase [Acidobacteriaceae bacterium]|nr:D-alanyl-D-alanine carboxypeptidase [Acidobacteriaceae bacterium]